ncbi:Metallo-beta-lactamase superfamily protein [Mycena kentingensis (nom. inval.)]|nr:Metallo-beta-lactamase superfamily protein [Mycena kentingensis (nom. inval.)]
MLALRLAALSAALPLALTLSGVPQSTSTVRVSRFNVGNLTAVNELHTLVAPILPGHDTFTFPMYSFLVEHRTHKLLFDIGARKDPENLAPGLAALFASGAFVGPSDTDIFDVLRGAGIPVESIESVIWSHAHFDHIGDMSKFPSSTSLVIGAETDISTFPTNPNGTLLESDFAGRRVTKIDFAASNLTFNDLKAFDYFGDGSFYLVDTPGHIPGHLTALARVTPSPKPTFLLLAGDTFHHPGEARPRPAFQKSFPCPAHLLASANAHISTDFFFSSGSHNGAFDMHTRASSLLSISDTADSFTTDPVLATVSLEKIARWDADDDVLVLIAHDISVVSNHTGSGGLGGLPYHPQTLNGWKKAGWKEETVWNFVDVDGPAWVFSPTV